MPSIRKYDRTKIQELIKLKQHPQDLQWVFQSRPIATAYRLIREAKMPEYKLINRNSKVLLMFEDKEIIPKEEVNGLLKKLFEDPNYTQTGVVSFWSRVATDYVGITMDDVKSFLDTNLTTQLVKKVHRRDHSIKPIITYRPKDMFQMDFIDITRDMSNNNNYRWILTVIDHFSKHAWAFPVKNISQNVTKHGQLFLILQKLLDDGHVPHWIYCDNEFCFQQLKDWLLTQRPPVPKMHCGRSYQPWSHGCIGESTLAFASQ